MKSRSSSRELGGRLALLLSERPCSVQILVDGTDSDEWTIGKYIICWHKLGAIHIGNWVGQVAFYKLGRGPDELRPNRLRASVMRISNGNARTTIKVTEPA